MGAVGGVAILGGNFEAPQFPEDKFIQRSITAGTQESSPIDAVILDAPALGAPGQLDSHAMLWKGHSNDGSPHTIDWKLFVDVTADDGTGSLWTLQTRIDAAPFSTVMTIDDAGLLTVSGATFTMDQLIIDSDNTEAVLIRKDGDAGDVFIVDTVNDVVRMGSDATTLTFGASSDAIFKYIGPGTVAFDDDVTEPFFQVVSGSDNTIGGLRWLINDRFQVGTFAASPRNVQITRGDVPIIEVTNAQVGFGTPGTPGDAIPLVFLFGNVPEDIIIMDTIALTSDGQRDSHSILWTGKAFESATPHDIDWKAFVNVTADDGTGSIFTIQSRIDAASFVDEFTITATTSPTLVRIGPGSTGGVLAFGPLGSDGPAQSGTLRFQNVDSIKYRNVNDDGDLNVWSTPESDAYLFGDPAMPKITMQATRLESNRINIVDSNTQAFVVENDSALNMFRVNTLENEVLVGEAVALQVATSVDRFIITGPSIGVNSTAHESHTFLMQGRTQTSGAVEHTSDWRMVVQPFTTTAFDGQSQLAFVGGIDGASLITPLKLVNDGRVAINQPEQFSIGSPTFHDNIQVNITGSFIDDYGGGPTTTHKVKIQGGQTGDSGRTDRQTTLDVDAFITTQNLSQTVNEVGSVFIDAPGLSIGTDTVNIGYTLKVNNTPTVATENYGLLVDSATSATNLTALTRIGKSFNAGIKLLVGGGVGAENIEGTAQMRLTNFYTPDGTQTEAMLLHVHSTLQATDGTTDHITGAYFQGSLRTQVATENVANISQVRIDEPNIQDSLTGDITNAQSLLITGAPTEGESNYAQRILGGDLQWANASSVLMRNVSDDGDLNIFTSPESDKLTFGDANMPEITIPTKIELFDQLEIIVDGVSALAVHGSTGPNILDVDTTNKEVDVNGDVFRFIADSSVVGSNNLEIRQARTSVSTASGSSVTAAGLIPAGSFVIGVNVRVLTTVTGPTGFDVGDGVDVDRWGNSIAVAGSTTTTIADYTSGALTLFPAANDVVITSDGVDFTGGSIRIVVNYITLTGPIN